MKATPVISVIVVNYNGLPYIDKCLTSILNQDYKNYEVIFVDNASTDGSLEFVKNKFPDVVTVAGSINTGYCGGINAGCSVANGKYIAPINVDTRVDSQWLSAMENFMELNTSVGAVTPKILLMDRPDYINTMGLDIHVSGLAFCRNLGKRNNTSYLPEKVSGISGCSFMIKRETLVKIGGMPEECFMANDDVILSWLINLMGLEIFCVPESVVYHQYHQNLNPSKVYNLEKNRYFLLGYGYKPVTFWLLSPILAITEIATICFAAIKGSKYIEAKLKAFTAFWREREIVKRRREQYEKLRDISDRKLLLKLKWIIKTGHLLSPF